MVSRIFQSFVGISLAVVFIGCAFIIQLTFSFIGVLLCGKCFSGERALGLCAFIFTMIFLVIIFACPLGSVILGWKYAFGDCQSRLFFLANASPEW
jgi:hypothetical protein